VRTRLNQKEGLNVSLLCTPEIQSQILSMHYGRKIGIRSIARELGLDRKTVRSIVQRRRVNIDRVGGGRGSILDPFKSLIEEILKTDPRIPVPTILSRIRQEGYLGGESILRDLVSKTRSVPSRAREPFLRIDFAPGECAQVDWGEFGDPFNDGVKIHCFLMVLCYSRLMYIEFTRSEKFEEFIRCHENAFKYFGGLVPQECWYDNLTSAVTDRMGSLVRFNARFLAYMGHHGIRPHACNPAKGNEKGRVESGVKFIRSSFWPARKFENFADLGLQSRTWLDGFANRREHHSTRKVPILHFQAEEREKMRLMNPHRYDTDEIFSRVVPPTFHIIYDTNKYSVPCTLVGLTVTVRSNDSEIRIFYNERFVASHARSFKKYQSFTTPEHQAKLLERKPGANSRISWQLAAIKNIGPRMSEYIELLKSGSRSLRSEVQKILGLSTIYGDAAVHEAVCELLDTATIGVNNLELLLKVRHDPESQLNPAPLNFQNSRLNRMHHTVDLRRYDAFLFEGNRSLTPTEASNEVPHDNDNDPNHSDET
jgi:transposase